ncbi:MAG: hypothetical protein NXI24_00130 [bacterium]|nr:hypothetical protein [bacterium]
MNSYGLCAAATLSVALCFTLSCATTVTYTGYPADAALAMAPATGSAGSAKPESSNGLRSPGSTRLRIAAINVAPLDLSLLPSASDQMIRRVPGFVTLLQAAGHEAHFFTKNDPEDVGQYDVIVRYRTAEARWREASPVDILALPTAGLWPSCNDIGWVREVVLRIPGGAATRFEIEQHNSRCYGWIPWIYRTMQLERTSGDWLEGTFVPADAAINPDGEAERLARTIVDFAERARPPATDDGGEDTAEPP